MQEGDTKQVVWQVDLSFKIVEVSFSVGLGTSCILDLELVPVDAAAMV